VAIVEDLDFLAVRFIFPISTFLIFDSITSRLKAGKPITI